MSKMPPIPPEQRSFGGEKARDRLRSAEPDVRDDTAGLQSGKSGRDVNVKNQGRSANIRQNTHYQQDR